MRLLTFLCKLAKVLLNSTTVQKYCVNSLLERKEKKQQQSAAGAENDY